MLPLPGAAVPVEPKIVIENRVLAGLSDDRLLQRIATVYVGTEEYRVYAPAKATGNSLEWLDNSRVHTPTAHGENFTTDSESHKIINLVREKLLASNRSSIEREQLQRPIARTQPIRTEATKRDNAMPSAKPSILVLISHSSKDVDLASALIELLRAGLGLLATQIRCSSVDGYRLPAGVDTDAQLRKEITDAGVLVGLLTPNSLSSTYVLFELGARWGIQRPMIPLLAGVTPDEMRGPHRVLNALSCSNESQLIQFIEDTGRELKIDPQSSASYLDKVRSVKKLSDAVDTRSARNSSAQEMVYEESVYWTMKNGKREGPYCPNCYDDERKVIHLNPGATRGTYGCGTCQNSFRTNEYNPRPSRRRPFSSR